MIHFQIYFTIDVIPLLSEKIDVLTEIDSAFKIGYDYYYELFRKELLNKGYSETQVDKMIEFVNNRGLEELVEEKYIIINENEVYIDHESDPDEECCSFEVPCILDDEKLSKAV